MFHTGATPACYDDSVEWMRQQRRSTQGRGDDHDLRGRYHDAEATMPHDDYYSRARHRAWRAAVIRRAGGLCEECRRFGRVGKDGLPVAATTAHHIKHRDECPELQYDVNNGRALCEACHNKAHPEKGRKAKYWY